MENAMLAVVVALAVLVPTVLFLCKVTKPAAPQPQADGRTKNRKSCPVPRKPTPAHPAKSSELSSKDEKMLPMARIEKTAASMDFSMRLLKAASTSSANFVISPLSIGSVIALLLEGSEGETRDELTKALFGGSVAPSARDHLCAQYAALLAALSSGLSPVTTIALTRIFLHKAYRVTDRFADRVQPLDLHDGERSSESINSFVREFTAGAIDAVTSAADFIESNAAVLVNVVYFEARWAAPFSSELTQSMLFHGVSGARQLEFMFGSDECPPLFWSSNEPFDGDDDGRRLRGQPQLTVIGLEYKDPAFLLLCYMPAGDYASWKGGVTADELQEAASKLRKAPITLALPKFAISAASDCRRVLAQLGVRRIFTAGAELGGISERNDLYVNKVAQKAKIEVGEEGTLAAAASAVHICEWGRSVNFDRPFLFVLRHCENVLFIGELC